MDIKFSFQTEYFDRNDYDFEVDLSSEIHLVEMTSNSPLNDVGLFISSLLDFNNLSLDSDFVDALFKEQELALVGGLLFEQNNVVIGASCCADFQDWSNVVKDIKRKCSPWMGHAPSPWFEFEDEYIILWSDREKLKNYNFIQFTQKEFDDKLIEAKQELDYFVEKVEHWAEKNYSTDSKKVVAGIKYYLGIAKRD